MSCPYYRWNGGSFLGDYWCDVKNERVNSDIYSRYCKGYYYDECSIYKKNNSSSGGCFITTIICDVLGKSDDDKVLKNLRYFRDNILTKDDKYKDLLIDYDNIGPVIAYEIEKDKDKKNLSNGLYDLILTKVSDLIENKDYEKAITRYEIMVLSLINYYDLKHTYNKTKNNNYGVSNDEISCTGHGRCLKPNKSIL